MDSKFKKLYYTPCGQAFMTGNAKILYKEYKEQKLKPEITLENVIGLLVL